jgi:hypothetical protein
MKVIHSVYKPNGFALVNIKEIRSEGRRRVVKN